MNPQESAAKRNQTLRSQSKKEVFNIYARTCLGRIFSEDLSIPKSWMIYDILVAEYGREIANKTARVRYYKIPTQDQDPQDTALELQQILPFKKEPARTQESSNFIDPQIMTGRFSSSGKKLHWVNPRRVTDFRNHRHNPRKTKTAGKS